MGSSRLTVKINVTVVEVAAEASLFVPRFSPEVIPVPFAPQVVAGVLREVVELGVG